MNKLKKLFNEHKMHRRKINMTNYMTIILLVWISITNVNCQENPYKLELSTNDLTVIVNETEHVNLLLRGTLNESVDITLHIDYEDLICVTPQKIHLEENNVITSNKRNVGDIAIWGKSPGSAWVNATSFPNRTWIFETIRMRVIIANSWIIYYISYTFGWIYFVAWSISFYPQIYTNFKRKSVVGLNFDFIVLNILGFILYSIFNIGLFWIPEIEQEYFHRKPKGLNPVLVNDIFFSLHAVLATSVTIIQCLIYENAGQKVSFVARGILGVIFLIITITAGLAAGEIFHWLDFLYYCSYIKLTITLIKYIPQAVMNYRRKSTAGWSIGNILLDFIGGTLSMMQMVLNAYNYDDWVSIFGDPTKFGLGLFSVCFDIFFMLQHYVFYSQAYDEIPGRNYDETLTSPTENTDSNDLSNIEDNLLAPEVNA